MKRIALGLVAAAALAAADTPAHCLHGQTVGVWTFYMTDNSGDNSISCPQDQSKLTVTKTMNVKLTEPDIALLQDGTVGFWTMMYDEGFHVNIAGQKFFAFQNYTVAANGTATSYCGMTNTGMYHDDPAGPGILPQNWGCYFGVKVGDSPVNVHPLPQRAEVADDAIITTDEEFAAEINKEQNLWTAGARHAFTGMPAKQAMRKLGKFVYHPPSAVKPNIQKGKLTSKQVSDLPENFDWRNADGSNYVCPVRNQGQCGSCYSFGSTGSLCSRVSVMTGGAVQSYWSPQTVVSCSSYSQGCDGGFSYNVFKFGEDFGIPWETCFPYQSGGNATVPPCGQKCNDITQYNYVTGYQFVGGYYGASTPELMMQEIMTNGPISVEFFVFPDFSHYTGGVYVHTQAAEKYMGVNPWEPTNHEVQMVGWGVDNGTPYWICQNSWGASWGENGYFRILRGQDECSIESIPAAGIPVLSSSMSTRD